MTKRLAGSYSGNFGKKDNEGLSKQREDGITISSRNMTKDIGCIIMKVRISKQVRLG